MRGRLPFALLVVGALAMGLAACGDPHDGGPAPTATATPEATATPRPTPASGIDVANLVGVYDLDASSEQREFSGASIAVVSRDDDGGLQVDLHFDVGNYIRLRATFVARNEVLLEGYGTFQGDLGFEVLGTGTASIGLASRRRISGSINGFAAFDEPSPVIDFVLERPAQPEVDAYVGRYRFEFSRTPSGCEPASHATLDLAFAGGGEGESRTAADDRGTGDVVFGRFEPGPCRLSPSGRLECDLEYVHRCSPPDGVPVESHIVRLGGQLVLGVEGATGTGHVEVPLFSPVLGGGTWTARR